MKASGKRERLIVLSSNFLTFFFFFFDDRQSPPFGAVNRSTYNLRLMVNRKQLQVLPLVPLHL